MDASRYEIVAMNENNIWAGIHSINRLAIIVINFYYQVSVRKRMNKLGNVTTLRNFCTIFGNALKAFSCLTDWTMEIVL